METKLELVTRYLQDVELARKQWDNNVVLPYARAYNKAYAAYNRVLDKQNKANAAKAELLFVGLSIVGGSAITAVIGKVALRTVVKDKVIAKICDLRMERTFNLVGILDSSPVASFATGKLLDAASKALTDAAKKSLQNPVPSEATVTNDAFDVYLAMLQVLGRAVEFATLAALDIRDNRSSADEARKALDILRQAPLMKPPRSLLYDAALADALELMMYLNFVTTRDTLVKGVESRFPLPPTRTAINAEPGSPEYPRGYRKDLAPNSGPRKVYAYAKVEIEPLGGEVDKRLNELHRKFFGKDLVADGWFLSTLTEQNIRDAIQSLRNLGTRYRRPEMLDVS
ncbi:hypothetical protein ACTJJ7_26750 [Phyllobacterium sp. 22229]|uniref:Uncharacterized protein n=1 Tax=Phyllobacterium myrsinacearum TaxID=28101 RepID=A0A2S9JAS0_9HYPH|nr:hypothetical protein [Phyllobacterium myrsinacearum]PRD49900.1 hypothetical protein C5750_24040 [Phyllobacterium myrsinacearum]PWV83388.1 hypothetical protein DEV92_1242 [Phyllobacterium myrsinacearum]RZS76748.1 hypothetical protein EV217_4971 [Phyllobacterium myrsinacearum]RZU97057.1 hypothetical protein EV654_5051 [Phyllobacterium myrsinacearum]